VIGFDVRRREDDLLMDRPRCYIASPLGFTEAGRYYYANVYVPALSAVVEPVDPWALTTDEEVAEAHRVGRARELALEIARRNSEAIRSCRLLAAVLDGQEPDSGTVAEVGFGAALGLTCYGMRSDFRECGEQGVSVNLQVEGFIVQSGGRVATSLDDLVRALADTSNTSRADPPLIAAG
jgi:nucleoside 2-deoxyribosyltransferase